MADGLRILVVDDDVVDRMAVRRALKAAGLQAEFDEASDSATAIDALRQKEYDCVLLDFKLPGADGLAIVRDVRAAGIKTPIIVLTGHGDEQIAVDLMKAGASDYLPKAKLTPDRLAQSIRSAIRVVLAEMRTEQATQRLRRSEENQRFLAEASRILGTSLDYTATLARVARLAVPHLATWCTIDLIEEAPRTQSGPPAMDIRLVVVAHADPQKETWALELRQRYPLDPDASHGIAAVLRTGQPQLVPEVNDEQLAVRARDAEHLRLLRELNPRSYLIVPLVARGRILGAISLVCSEPDRIYGPADLILAEDLARRAALAVDNARLYEEAQEAIRVREQFLSIASHELKTPVTVIQGYTQVLMRSVEKSLAARAPVDSEELDQVRLDRKRLTSNLQNLERATRRLTTLVDELLDVSRIQNRKLSISPERTNLSAVLASVIDSVRVQQRNGLYSNAVLLQMDTPLQGEVWGEFDRSRLEQVLINLIDNAMKYSPDGGMVTVGLTVERGIEPASSGAPGELPLNWAHLTIRDQGIGIPPDQQEQIFQPFVRASNALEGSMAGLGLGLAISKEIVERHGGRIWVESEGPGRGSIFHVTLPGVSIAEDLLGAEAGS